MRLIFALSTFAVVFSITSAFGDNTPPGVREGYNDNTGERAPWIECLDRSNVLIVDSGVSPSGFRVVSAREQSNETSFQDTSGSANASARLGFGSFGGAASSSVLRTHSVAHDQQYLLIERTVMMATQSVRVSSGRLGLLSEAAQLSGADFLTNCGTRYVSELSSGGRVEILWTFTADTEQSRNEIARAISGFVSAPSANGAVAFNQRVQQISSSSRVRMEVNGHVFGTASQPTDLTDPNALLAFANSLESHVSLASAVPLSVTFAQYPSRPPSALSALDDFADRYEDFQRLKADIAFARTHSDIYYPPDLQSALRRLPTSDQIDAKLRTISRRAQRCSRPNHSDADCLLSGLDLPDAQIPPRLFFTVFGQNDIGYLRIGEVPSWAAGSAVLLLNGTALAAEGGRHPLTNRAWMRTTLGGVTSGDHRIATNLTRLSEAGILEVQKDGMFAEDDPLRAAIWLPQQTTGSVQP